MASQKKPNIHIVGSIDLKEQTGRFLYVTPTHLLPEVPGESDQAGSSSPAKGSEYELVALNSAGVELSRSIAQVFIDSDSDNPTNGLVDQTIEQVSGMAVLVLETDGTEIARFEAGNRPEPASMSVALGPPMPESTSLRPMKLEGMPPLEPGATYTIEVRPEGDSRWHTIAIGVRKIDLALDRNQFPDAASAEVRIRRTNGFDEEIIVQDTLRLTE